MELRRVGRSNQRCCTRKCFCSFYAFQFCVCRRKFRAFVSSEHWQDWFCVVHTGCRKLICVPKVKLSAVKGESSLLNINSCNGYGDHWDKLHGASRLQIRRFVWEMNSTNHCGPLSDHKKRSAGERKVAWLFLKIAASKRSAEYRAGLQIRSYETQLRRAVLAPRRVVSAKPSWATHMTNIWIYFLMYITYQF